VVEATGRTAAFGRATGARPVVAWDQIAVVGIGHHQGPDQPGPGLTEAVETVFWYSAPVPGRRWMAAHYTQAGLLDRAALRNPAQWQAQVDATAHTRTAMPPGLVWDPPHVHSAGTRLLTPPAGPGWIAVGDAAMCWDPVSAHGLTLALRTGVDGADALLRELHGDPGPRTAYVERLRSATNQFTAEVAALWRQEQRWPDSDYWQWRLTADPWTPAASRHPREPPARRNGPPASA
jgi:2-polyprenyl-6-methoxyphenol hydroxylase-like FAD-dependent oxidoreductase